MDTAKLDRALSINATYSNKVGRVRGQNSRLRPACHQMTRQLHLLFASTQQRDVYMDVLGQMLAVCFAVGALFSGPNPQANKDKSKADHRGTGMVAVPAA